MTKRIVLTASEIDAILSIAGDADAGATVESVEDEKEGERLLQAFESGMEKLRAMLARAKRTANADGGRDG